MAVLLRYLNEIGIASRANYVKMLEDRSILSATEM